MRLVLDAELAEDSLLVVLDRLVTDGQLRGDLPRREAGADEGEDRQLVGGQHGIGQLGARRGIDRYGERAEAMEGRGRPQSQKYPDDPG